MTKKPKASEVQAQKLAPRPFEEGLTVVLAPRLSLGHLCDLYEREAATGDHQSKNMRTEPCEVVALRGGGGQVAKKAEAYALAMAPSNKLERRTFRADGDARHFEYGSNEGFKTLEFVASKNEGKLLTFQALDIPAISLQSVMQRLRALGRTYDVALMMFLASSNDAPTNIIQDNCDQLIQVRDVEPDPDAVKAFVIEDAEMDGLSFGSENRVMCQIYQRDDGLRERRFSPHLADSLRDRFMWELRAHGYQQVQLAEVWGVDPSTISRDLKAVPRIKPGSRRMDGERMRMLADHFGIDLPDLPVAKLKVSAMAVPVESEAKADDNEDPWADEANDVAIATDDDEDDEDDADDEDDEDDADYEDDDDDDDAPKNSVVNKPLVKKPAATKTAAARTAAAKKAAANKTQKGHAPSAEAIRNKWSTPALKNARSKK